MPYRDGDDRCHILLHDRCADLSGQKMARKPNSDSSRLSDSSLPVWDYEPSDCESTSRLEVVALRFAHLIKCFWKLQLVRSRFAAYGAYLQRLEASGRGLLLDILSNCYPSAEVQGRVPKLLRDRRREVLDYSCFQRFEERHGCFWEPSASSSSYGWEAAD